MPVVQGQGEYRYQISNDLAKVPPGMAVDSHGDVYVGEVSATAWPQLKPDEPPPSPLHSLRKMTRLPPA